MEKKPTPQLLRVPLPSKTQISLCQPTVKAVSRWLADLPKANLGETARLLYQMLLELNELTLSNEDRLKLLELLRPEVFTVCRNLERYFLGQAIVLDEKARKVANLTQALQNYLSVGYKLIAITELRQPQTDAKLMALALERTLYGVYQILLRACQLYQPVPDGLWLELHQLYQVALRQQLHEQPLSEPQMHGQKRLNIQNVYVLSLLLGSAQTNQIRQSDIAKLSEALEHWTLLANLGIGLAPNSLFVIHPKFDQGPRYRSLQSYPDPTQLATLDTQMLTDAIEQYLLVPDASNAKLHIPQYFSQDLLRHLAAAWGEIAERTFQRSPAQGTRTVSIGMSAVHYFCAGKRAFADLLKAKIQAKPSYQEQERIDVWAKAIDAQNDVWNSARLEYEEIQFSSPNQPASTAESNPDSYPSYSLNLVNVSPSGYCLAWPEEVPSQLQSGELLGIQESDSEGYAIAVVRWIRQIRGGGTHMGVELIAPRAYPCGLKLLRNGDSDSVYLRALMLPAIDAISRPATLITPRLPFQESSKVMINQDGEQSRAVLGQRLASTASFSHFQFNRIELPANPTLELERGAIVPDDFDSLWKTL